MAELCEPDKTEGEFLEIADGDGSLMRMRILPREEGEASAHYVSRLLYYNIMMLIILPGTRLHEGRIAEGLGISKTPIHQAVGRLEQMLMVSVKPQSATRVTRISFDLVRQSVFMRLAVESRVCSQVAACLSADEAVLLRDNIARQKSASNVYDFISLDNDFHRIVYSIAKKDYVWLELRQGSAHFDRLRYMGLIKGYDTAKPEEHETLLNMLEFNGMTGTSETAEFEGFLRRHLCHFSEYLNRLILEYPEYFDISNARVTSDTLQRVTWLL